MDMLSLLGSRGVQAGLVVVLVGLAIPLVRAIIPWQLRRKAKTHRLEPVHHLADEDVARLGEDLDSVWKEGMASVDIRARDQDTRRDYKRARDGHDAARWRLVRAETPAHPEAVRATPCGDRGNA